MSKNHKEYTTLEKAFLEHLFNDAEGDIKKAMLLAGYGENNSTSQIVKQLSDEIIELSKAYLAGHAPKAILATLGVLDKPDALGAGNRIKAANSILDRAGLAKPDDSIKVSIGSSGVIILPAKNAKVINEVTEEEAEEKVE